MFNFKPLIATGLAAVALSSVFNATTSLATPPVKITYASQSADITEKVVTGKFTGRSDHVTTGDVSIVKIDTGYQLVFSENFSLDGAPDPIVGFGNNGKFVKASKLGTLTNLTGAQTYQLPASYTPGQFSEVHVYCEKFSVPLGVASIS